jgi:hypothetical protein
VDTPHYTPKIPLIDSHILDCLIWICRSKKDEKIYAASYQDKKQDSGYCAEIVKWIVGRGEIPVSPIFNIEGYPQS